jgi:uncharacterized protein YkwD
MGTAKRLSCLVLAFFATALVTAPGAMAANACESASAAPSAVDQRIVVRSTLCVLNAERERYGLRPLRLNKRLSRASRRHARDMARRNYFSHDSVGGASFVDRIRRTGYLSDVRSWTVGENIAWGSHSLATPRSIGRAWMNSPGHRANILSRQFREIGIGVAYGAPVGGGGEAATYATDFGARR